jgi:hypothetical protein
VVNFCAKTCTIFVSMKVLNSTFKSNFAQRQYHPKRLAEKKIRGFFLSVIGRLLFRA